jgi:hypothetical protein
MPKQPARPPGLWMLILCVVLGAISLPIDGLAGIALGLTAAALGATFARRMWLYTHHTN